MDNWRDYIDFKFTPKEEFTFKIEYANTISIKHIKTGTTFTFWAETQDWYNLADVQYYNDKAIGFSGEFNEVLPFKPEKIIHVDNFLKPAFETGWVSKDIFLFEKHWKSKVYFNPNMRGKGFHYYSSRLGCLSIILFPLFSIFAFFFGQKKVVIISPVKNNKSSDLAGNEIK